MKLDFPCITGFNRESGLSSSVTSRDTESGRKGIEREDSGKRSPPGRTDFIFQ